MTLIPPSASTRFQPPTPIGRWLERPRMNALFEQSQGRRLTLIHAPAGFGKSTLAAQWLSEHARRGARTAWLSLDEDDNRPLWFLTHLLECFKRVHTGLAENVAQVIEERPEDAERFLLPVLINAVYEVPESTIIVLDDWHLIEDPRSRAILAKLLDGAAGKLGLIITSRTTLGLPLPSHRVQDQLVEVDPRALRFDVRESHEFLVGMKGITLSDAEFSELHEKTEGWVAALQLTSLSLRKHADPTALLTELGTRQHGVGEYLAENVLDLIEPRLREFLLRTSVLTRMNTELAELLSDFANAGELIDQALTGDLFLQRLGETGGWYRYHHLFADFLRERLEHEYPGLARELHFRAAQWYAENGLLSLAVDHAILADEHRFAAEVIERSAMRLVEQSRMSTLLTLVEKLAPGEVESRPWLLQAVAWAYCLLHFPEAADRSLRELDAAIEAIPSLSAAERFRLSTESLVVRECLEMYQDRVSDDHRLRFEVLDQADKLDPWTVSVAANVLTFFEINRDRGPEAARLQQWARQHHGNVVGSFSEVYGELFAGLIAFHDLNTALVKHHWERAFRVGKERSGEQSLAARLALGLLGKLHYHLGHLDTAEEMFEEALRVGQRAGVVDFMFPVYESLASIRMDRGDASGAREVLEQGELAGHDLALVRLWSRMATTKARLGLGAETPSTEPEASERERGFLRDEQIRFDLAIALTSPAGTPSEASLIAAAQEMIRRTRAHGNRFQAMRDQVTLAGVLEHRGDHEAASTLLEQVLPGYEASGLIQSLREGGEQVRSIARRIAECWSDDPAQARSRAWLCSVWGSSDQGVFAAEDQPVYRPSGPNEGAASALAPEQFTSREREIIRLLDEGKTNREIGDQLYLGVNTIKWYLRKIFRLLEVSSREECVRRAKRLKVIPDVPGSNFIE